MDDYDEDEPTEVELAESARIEEAISRTSPAARRFVEDFVEDYGEALPTLLLGLLGRWYTEQLRLPEGDATHDALLAVDAISDLYAFGDERMQTIVATGFLEALPFRRSRDRHVVRHLPWPLRRELHAMETWTPG